MCFNETASLVAFSIGVISTIILFQMKLYKFSIFYISIFLMQLVEYYAHKSLLTNNVNMNKLASYFGYFLILSQPIILSYITYNNINKKFQKTLIFLCLSFITFGLFSFYQNYKSNKFRISYIENICENIVCRLKWEYFNINFYHNFIFGLFYFGIMVLIGYNRKVHNDSILLILTFLLGLTILYMMFETKQINTFKTSIFGSLWCYLCVLAGPLVIMNKNLIV